MILFDEDIWAAYQGKLFEIFPPIRPRELSRIQPASIDVRMGGELVQQAITGRVRSLDNPAEFNRVREDSGGGFVLNPGSFYLGSTLEEVHLSKYIAMQVEGKSSWGRLGLEVHSTAGWVDPGFAGQITLEMKVVGRDAVYIRPGDPIAQLTVFKSRVGSQVPYGHPARKSKYQGQIGPTPNRKVQ